MCCNKNPTASTASALIRAHLSPAAQEQFLQRPGSCCSCANRVHSSRSVAGSFREVLAFITNHSNHNDPDSLFLYLLQLCWLQYSCSWLKLVKRSMKLGSCVGCNSKQTEVGEMAISSFPPLQCCYGGNGLQEGGKYQSQQHSLAVLWLHEYRT